jgi:hypothetical protein
MNTFSRYLKGFLVAGIATTSLLAATPAHAAVAVKPPSVLTQLSTPTADSNARVAAVSLTEVIVLNTVGDHAVARRVEHDGNVVWERSFDFVADQVEHAVANIALDNGNPIMAVVATAPDGTQRTHVVALDGTTGDQLDHLVLGPAAVGSFAAMSLGVRNGMLAVIGSGVGKFGIKATKKSDVVIAGVRLSSFSLAWWTPAGGGGEDTAVDGYVAPALDMVVAVQKSVSKKTMYSVSAFKIADGKRAWKKNLPKLIDWSQGAIASTPEFLLVGAPGGVQRLDPKGKAVGWYSTGAGTNVRSITVGMTGWIASGTITGAGGTDAFVSAFTFGGAQLWTDTRASSGADVVNSATWDGDAFVVAGTTTGIVSGSQADPDGDVFLATYGSPIPPRPSPVENLGYSYLIGNGVLFAWDPPAETGGLPVDNYRVEVRAIGDKVVSGFPKLVTTTELLVPFTSLRPGTAYSFSITANTLAGKSGGKSVVFQI